VSDADAGADRETVVVKLGGSVVTDKRREETVDEAALGAAADAIGAPFDEEGADGADADAGTDGDANHPRRPNLVVVHGGGSFGHPHAAAAGVSTSAGTHDPAGARAVHDAMKRLNGAVLDALLERGVPALPVHPLSVAARDADGALTFPVPAVAGMLAEGFVPLTHGDGVVHAGEGVSVLSGDEVVAHLADALDADRVGLCSTVPGVLDADGHVIDRVESFADVAAAVGASDATDVTGGMAGKVRTLLAVDGPAFVFGPDDLPGFLAGRDVGTRID
jgi:isopentenyl phosphate kinase